MNKVIFNWSKLFKWVQIYKCRQETSAFWNLFKILLAVNVLTDNKIIVEIKIIQRIWKKKQLKEEITILWNISPLMCADKILRCQCYKYMYIYALRIYLVKIQWIVPNQKFVF